jgi:preprotein translocase subunit YajC
MMNPIALWTSLLPLAEAAPKPGPTESPNMLLQLLPFLFIFVIIYFLMIHPQRKRQRERTGMLEVLKKGDKIVTVGGIHGIITLVRDRDIVIKVDDNCKLTLSKSGIGRVLPSEEAESKDKDKEEK